MGDAIDERNRREKSARSIVKFWNVNYTIPQPPDESEEILKRLKEEAEEEEAAKWAEIDALVEQERLKEEAAAAPGGLMDGVTDGQIERILHEGADVPEDPGE